MKTVVILPAAGLGTRMARLQPETSGVSRKQFMLLDGAPILLHTLRKFDACEAVTEIVLALRSEDLEGVREMVEAERFTKPLRYVEGGDSRQESVANAIAALAPDTDLVAVHDAVRPFVSPSLISEVIEAARHSGAAILGVVPVDTVKEVHRNKVRATLLREQLILTQTPQVFRYDLLKTAFERARDDGFTATDEASLVERLEVEVTVVAGSNRNIKITRPSDMLLAKVFLEAERAEALAAPALAALS